MKRLRPLLALAGAPAPFDAEGVNRLPFLTGGDASEPRRELAWRFGMQKAIHRGNWKLVDWRDLERKSQSGWELYDLSVDLGDRHNLAVAHSEKLAELVAAWNRWNAKNIAPAWQEGLAPQRAAASASSSAP